MSLESEEMNGTLAAAWKRQLVRYNESIHAVYSDEALTGWAALITEPRIGTFKGTPCLIVSLPLWIMLKTLASETVTPFRIAAQGKNIIVGAWQGITGLKYAIRNTEWGACLHIPLTDFEPLG